MIAIEDMERMLDELATEFPSEFYTGLNGGIVVLPDEKFNKKIGKGNLCILGEYYSGGNMGRYIAIYYGSFMRVFGYLGKEQLKARLKKTLRHEFTHHLESLAGEHGLEIKDAKFISDYLKRRER